MTSNLALGANNAIESAAALANELHRLAGGHNQSPTPSAIEEAFARYQAAREARARQAMEMTGGNARLSIWKTQLGYLINRYVLPRLSGQRITDWMLSPYISGGVVLDFVDVKSVGRAKIPWKYPDRAADQESPQAT